MEETYNNHLYDSRVNDLRTLPLLVMRLEGLMLKTKPRPNSRDSSNNSGSTVLDRLSGGRGGHNRGSPSTPGRSKETQCTRATADLDNEAEDVEDSRNTTQATVDEVTEDEERDQFEVKTATAQNQEVKAGSTDGKDGNRKSL